MIVQYNERVNKYSIFMFENNNIKDNNSYMWLMKKYIAMSNIDNISM